MVFSHKLDIGMPIQVGTPAVYYYIIVMVLELYYHINCEGIAIQHLVNDHYWAWSPLTYTP
jgi:hypothetical protein